MTSMVCCCFYRGMNQEVINSGGCICPLAGCTNAAFFPPPLPTPEITCPACEGSFCKHCAVKWGPGCCEHGPPPLPDENELAAARRLIVKALGHGQTVSCPTCGTPWRKDDACMHMQCTHVGPSGTACGTQFCYICGQRRGGDNKDCQRSYNCDRHSCFLERNREFPDDKHEALIWFHTHRILFLLRCARAKIGERVVRNCILIALLLIGA
eukprot:SAG31_NODE_8227_length_1493_cov_2.142755_2_plen_211_part_00